jgi:class 3 adenylate cyclase
VSDAAVTASDPTAVRFVEVGPVDLKGIAEPVRLFSARDESA